MSWVSSAVRRNKGVIRKIGKGIDFASDFLPPGFRDVGNFGSKLMQGQNLKRAAIGTGMDYGIGRAIKGLGAVRGLGGGSSVAEKVGRWDPGSVITNVAGGGTGVLAGRSAATQLAGGGVREGIRQGVRRGIKGLSAKDILRGGATAYDIYGQQQDRSYNRTRNDRDDRMYAEDRARKQRQDDEDRTRAEAERSRRQGLEDIDRKTEADLLARKLRLDDEQLGRNAQDRTADAQWFDSLAPFRTAGMQGLLNPQAVDFSGIFNAPPPVVQPITTPGYATLDPRRRPLR